MIAYTPATNLCPHLLERLWADCRKETRKTPPSRAIGTRGLKQNHRKVNCMFANEPRRLLCLQYKHTMYAGLFRMQFKATYLETILQFAFLQPHSPALY